MSASARWDIRSIKCRHNEFPGTQLNHICPVKETRITVRAKEFKHQHHRVFANTVRPPWKAKLISFSNIKFHMNRGNVGARFRRANGKVFEKCLPSKQCLNHRAGRSTKCFGQCPYGLFVIHSLGAPPVLKA